MGRLGMILRCLRVEEKAMERPGILRCWQDKLSSRGWDKMAAPSQLTMAHDEVGRDPVASQVTGACRMVDSNGEILVHLEMEMGGVHSMVCSNSADLLSPFALLAFSYGDPVEVAVE